MIDITKDIKNGKTTIAEFHEDDHGDIVTTEVTVTKKKVATAKGIFESVKIVTTPSVTPLSVTTALLTTLEAVG